MPRKARIAKIRLALGQAQQAMGPESRRILENARRAAGRSFHREKGDAGETIESIEDLGGFALRLPPEAYLLLALEGLADIVEELEA